jgi:hypothetical protein
MRPTATAALILSLGLVAAACSGDDVTPAPAGVTPAAVASAPAEAPAGTGAPADAVTAAPADAAAGSTPVAEFAKKAAHTSEDDPNATYGLVSGRYRLAWDTPPDDSEDACTRVEVAVVQQDGDFEYVRGSTSRRFNATVNDLPQGAYKLEQRDPSCTTWQLRIDWMTN